MKATIEVDFANDAQAEKALIVLKSASTSTARKAKNEDDEFIDKEEGERARVSWEKKGRNVIALIEARDYAALRARSTSVLRDFKIVTDSMAIIKQNK
ncbi:MAG TPA: KEOPS complex subunit Pcc1 [Candidatus Norongarragalinales archaeon]|jgi:tRNA threonylcarbamoyladenosine modification (KEOPS) complex  Pcc1 subunit|nr:KEOPS complex subunit Pcc1 [Candidatus Norongarragalinales archaeon]